jgi:hypothetical protein
MATPLRRPRRRNGIDASFIHFISFHSGHVPSTPPSDERSPPGFLRLVADAP